MLGASKLVTPRSGQHGRSSICRSFKKVPRVLAKTQKLHMKALPKRAYTPGAFVLKPIFKDKEYIVEREMTYLTELATTLTTLGASKEDISEIHKSITQLGDLFMLVIVGEFNSGKTSFLNAMFGQKLLKEGVTPTTNEVQLLRHGDKQCSTNLKPELIEIQLPVDWLKDITLVDTPGTNAVITGHQQITEDFVPRSDMVLFITSADRAFTESERAFLEKIREYDKKVVVIVSKIDVLDSKEQLDEILQFIKEQSSRFFKYQPTIFPVSSKKALAAKTKVVGLPVAEQEAALALDPLWNESRFNDVEEYIHKTTNKDRALLKLRNPLGVAELFLNRHTAMIDHRIESLRVDNETLANINVNIKEFREEMMSTLKFHESRLESVLLKISERATLFFEDKIAITNTWNLMNSTTLQSEFDRDVVGDANAEIDRIISEMVDMIVDRSSRKWSDLALYADSRMKETQQNVVGTVRTQYNYNRAELLAIFGDEASRAIRSFDRRQESDQIAAEMKAAVYQTIAVGFGAAGLVAVFFPVLVDYLAQGAIFTVTLFDLTGILGAGALAVFGMAILPYKKSMMRRTFVEKMSGLRTKLTDSIHSQFEQQLERSLSSIQSNLSPYSSFINRETEVVTRGKRELTNLTKSLVDLKYVIDGL